MYVFTVLPFVLSTACYVFTKLMRPLVRLWGGAGIRCVVYIDDGLIMSEGQERDEVLFWKNSLDEFNSGIALLQSELYTLMLVALVMQDSQLSMVATWPMDGGLNWREVRAPPGGS